MDSPTIEQLAALQRSDIMSILRTGKDRRGCDRRGNAAVCGLFRWNGVTEDEGDYELTEAGETILAILTDKIGQIIIVRGGEDG